MKMCLVVLKVERKNRMEVHVYAHDRCQANLSIGWLVCACIKIFHEVITSFWQYSAGQIHFGRCILTPYGAHKCFELQGRTPPPPEASLVIFGLRALIFFCLKALGKNEKWHHFCAHAQWWSPWRRKNVEKGHLAPSNLTFLLIVIDRNGFRRLKEEGLVYKTLPEIF